VVRLGGPDPGRVDDGPGRDLDVATMEQVGRQHAQDSATARLRPDSGGSDTREGHGAGGHRGAGHGEGVARVVLHAVVVEQPAAETLMAKGRRQVERLGAGQPSMPAAVAPGTQDVVERQPGVVERFGQVRATVDRKEQRLEVDEVRREGEQPRSLGQRLADQPDPELLEVSQAAMDQPRGARRRPRGDVLLLDQHGTQAA
jgi:hypothetical protein